jgi:hypothetical protein
MSGQRKRPFRARSRSLTVLLVDPRLRILSVDCRHRAAEKQRNKAFAAFWLRVDTSGTANEKGCWPWTGATSKAGYGVFCYGDESLAHRVSYALAHGSAKGIIVRHTCDNPPCVRPDHLIAGSHGDNIADKMRRGRAKGGAGCQVGERNNAATITEHQAQTVLDLWATGQFRQVEIARLTAVTRNNVGNIIHRISWTHLAPRHEGVADDPR